MDIWFSRFQQDAVPYLQSLVAAWGLRLLAALGIFLVAWLVGGWARNAIQKRLEGRVLDPTLARFSSQGLRYVILVAAFIACLGIVGIETTGFAAVLAAMGLAIGLALQGTLGNFASGLMMLVFRPFRVGDFVRAAGEMGTVEELGMFSTELKTPDARKIVVPNGAIFSGNIENFSHHAQRRVDIPVGVSYEADIDATRRVLEGAVAKLPAVLQDPAPQIFLKGLGGSSVDWVVRVWCNAADFWSLYEATIRQVKMDLDTAQIEIPFPQMSVHMASQAVSDIRALSR